MYLVHEEAPEGPLLPMPLQRMDTAEADRGMRNLEQLEPGRIKKEDRMGKQLTIDHFVYSDEECCMHCKHTYYDMDRRAVICRKTNQQVKDYTPACRMIERGKRGLA